MSPERREKIRRLKQRKQEERQTTEFCFFTYTIYILGILVDTRDTDVLLRIVFSIILILTIYFWRRVLKKNEGLGA